MTQQENQQGNNKTDGWTDNERRLATLLQRDPKTPTPNCCSPETLFDLLTGRTRGKAATRVRAHIAHCAHCAHELAQAAQAYRLAEEAPSGVPIRPILWRQTLGSGLAGFAIALGLALLYIALRGPNLSEVNKAQIALRQEREQRVAAEQAARRLQQENQTLTQGNQTLQQQQTRGEQEKARLAQESARWQQQAQNLNFQVGRLKAERNPAHLAAGVEQAIASAVAIAPALKERADTAGAETLSQDWVPLAPLAKILFTSRVECRWMPLKGAEQYTLEILHESDYRVVARSRPTRDAHAEVSVPLSASGKPERYIWQVEVRMQGQAKSLKLFGSRFAIQNIAHILSVSERQKSP